MRLTESFVKRIKELAGINPGSEETLSEDYPINFNMEEFKSLNSYAKRLKYAAERLKKLGAGSSRIVFDIDGVKVLKIARNDKGLAQNETESLMGKDSFLDDKVAHVFEFHPKFQWVEMEKALKPSPTIFRKITGVDIVDLSDYLFEKYKYHNKGIKYSNQELIKKLDENDFVINMEDVMVSYDMSPGDLGKLNSYGVITRDGAHKIVLVDFGLSSSVGEEHYGFVREDENEGN